MTTPKAALVTGGAKRIGKAMALYLADRGCDIALHYNRSEGEAKEVRAQIQSRGVRCELFQAEMADIDAVFALANAVYAAFPHWDLLVNSASTFELDSFATVTPAFFHEQYTINFTAPFFLSQRFAALTHVQSGHIVNMIDCNIDKHSRRHVSYMFAKKNLWELTQLLPLELGPRIRVNAIGPGLILPPPGEPEAYLDARVHKVPSQTKGGPDDIVRALAYLLDSPFVNGQLLHVDGGQHIVQG